MNGVFRGRMQKQVSRDQITIVGLKIGRLMVYMIAEGFTVVLSPDEDTIAYRG